MLLYEFKQRVGKIYYHQIYAHAFIKFLFQERQRKKFNIIIAQYIIKFCDN